jgi:hypothetical protein
MDFFSSFFETSLLHFGACLCPATNASGRMVGVSIDVCLLVFAVEDVLVWVVVLWVVERVLVMCLSVRVVLLSMPCEADMLKGADKYMTTAVLEEKDTLYI